MSNLNENENLNLNEWEESKEWEWETADGFETETKGSKGQIVAQPGLRKFKDIITIMNS